MGFSLCGLYYPPDYQSWVILANLIGYQIEAKFLEGTMETEMKVKMLKVVVSGHTGLD